MRTLRMLSLALVWIAVPAAATPPAPIYGSAVVDGLYAEWNIPDDFFADMYRAGNPSHPLESKAYLRYDCTHHAMYVLVLDEPGVIGYHDPSAVTSWVAIDHQNNKVVNEDAGNDGVPPDFAWVGEGYDGNPLHNRGFEASFTIQPGTYHIIIHTDVWDGGTQTSATMGFPGTGPLLVIDCTLTGACCAPDGSCTITTTAACAAPNVWHGEWTSCTPDPCPQPLGACCAPDGSCTMTFQMSCAYEWLGYGSACSPNPCQQPAGACCHPDGGCSLTVEADCPPPDLWLGMGTSCEPNPCAQPLGACCHEDGTCALTAQADCQAPNIWLGEGTSCEPDPCPQPAGACCLTDCSCTIATQAECEGQWLGPDIGCDPNPCPCPTGACCYPDGTCSLLPEVQCEPPAAWMGPDTVCEPDPCPQPLGACCNPATGECTMTTQPDCVPPDNWLGAGIDCEPTNPCPAVPSEKTTWGQIKSRYGK
jgi:hypothetical protein